MRAGSGKTSLLNALAGRLEAGKGSSLCGTVHINGRDRETSSKNIIACALPPARKFPRGRHVLDANLTSHP